jgi:hypothetical protein
MKSIFLLVAALLGLFSSAQAASIRTIAFTLPEEVLTMDARLANAPEAVPLTVTRGNLGTKVDLTPGAYNLTIPSLNKAAKFAIPESGPKTYILLVFVTEKTPLSVVLVPDGSDNIPYGTYYMINALDKDVAVQFDNQKVLLKPTKAHVFKTPNIDPPNNYFTAELYTVFGEFKVPTRFIRSSWPAWQDRRFISLIFNDPAFGRPLVRSIEDMKDAPEEPDPSAPVAGR